MTIKMREGTVYGRLILISDVPYRINGRTSLQYRCVCDCGRSILADGSHLRQGKTQSCGCLQAESQQKNLSTTHGQVMIRLTVKDRIK